MWWNKIKVEFRSYREFAEEYNSAMLSCNYDVTDGIWSEFVSLKNTGKRSLVDVQKYKETTFSTIIDTEDGDWDSISETTIRYDKKNGVVEIQKDNFESYEPPPKIILTIEELERINRIVKTINSTSLINKREYLKLKEIVNGNIKSSPVERFNALSTVGMFIITPLDTMKYKDFLRTTYWETIKNYIKYVNYNGCQICQSKEKLNVHHKTYEHRGHEYLYPENSLVLLCQKCHSKYHDILCVGVK